MAKQPKIAIGSVIWADVCEPNGKSAGEHPAIVLSSQAEIDAGADLNAVVCSTGFSYPLPSGWFDMPTRASPGGDPQTGLFEACVAKATWLQSIPQASVRRVSGRAPARIVRAIMDWLDAKKREQLRDMGEPP